MTTTVFLGDSFAGGTGAIDAAHAYCQIAGALLGWTVTVGANGYGYVGENPPASAYATTDLGLVEATPPDVVVLAGGFHDQDVDAGTLATAVDTVISRMVATGATVIVQSPSYGSAGGSGGQSTIEWVAEALEAKALTAGLRFIDMRGWFTGTGYVGSEQSDGNADAYIGADGVHPTQAGHDFLGARWAYEFTGARWITGLATEDGHPLALEIPA